MSRRNPLAKTALKGAAVMAAVILLSGVVLLFLVKHSNPVAGLHPFPLDSYMEGGSLWGQEEYALEGKVENVLLCSDNRKKFLVSIRPKDSELILPVVLEAKFGGGTPVQREQQLVMRVHVDSSAKIQCTAHD